MIQALRNELASAEHRVEEERMAHSATRHVTLHLFTFGSFSCWQLLKGKQSLSSAWQKAIVH
jgi:hypothetical protein